MSTAFPPPRPLFIAAPSASTPGSLILKSIPPVPLQRPLHSFRIATPAFVAEYGEDHAELLAQSTEQLKALHRRHIAVADELMREFASTGGLGPGATMSLSFGGGASNLSGGLEAQGAVSSRRLPFCKRSRTWLQTVRACHSTASSSIPVPHVVCLMRRPLVPWWRLVPPSSIRWSAGI
eukprot:scaffold1327_cov135-Isochrysis_galbana.AAC.4